MDLSPLDDLIYSLPDGTNIDQRTRCLMKMAYLTGLEEAKEQEFVKVKQLLADMRAWSDHDIGT